MHPTIKPRRHRDVFLKRLSLLVVLAGIVVLLFGWHWGRLRDFVWKGNLTYSPRNTEEIPRPFEQVFENYVEDQWPFVLMAGGFITIVGFRCMIGCQCKKDIQP